MTVTRTSRSTRACKAAWPNLKLKLDLSLDPDQRPDRRASSWAAGRRCMRPFWRGQRPGRRGIGPRACPAGCWCSASPACRASRWRSWRPWRAGRRSCCASTTPASTTGLTSSPIRTCSAPRTADSGAAPACLPPSRRSSCTCMPIPCWPPGANRAGTSLACWTSTTTWPPVTVMPRASRPSASASTSSIHPGTRPGSPASWPNSRTTSATCAPWPRAARAGPPSTRPATAPYASTSPIAPSARWRSSTTNSWRPSTPTPA